MRSFARTAFVSIFVFVPASCQSPTAGPDPLRLGTAESELIAAQCHYFAVNGRTQICHATGSALYPYTILKVAEQACIDAHANHVGDYIAVGDPTCHGGGCLPADAPCDATVPCCDGLICDNGTCKAVGAVVAAPSATNFMWQGVQEGLGASGQVCAGVVAAGMGAQALCYTASDSALMCAGRVFQTTWGPSFVDTGLRDVEQVFISGISDAMCVKRANGTIWCMGDQNNAIFGYGSAETSATFVQWGSSSDIHRMATGTWDQLCAWHADGRVDCSGYGFGGSYHGPVLQDGGAPHRSAWVMTTGDLVLDDPAVFRASASRTECQVTVNGLQCADSTFGTPGAVVDGVQILGAGTCYLERDGKVLCSGGCQGPGFCPFLDAQGCTDFLGCSLAPPTQHFKTAPVLLLVYNPYTRAVCGVLNDGSMACFGQNDQGMLGTGGTDELVVDTEVAPRGSVKVPVCN